MSAAEIARGHVAADGKLIDADGALLRLLDRAGRGGEVGAGLAVPQLAELARIVHRLRAPMARGVITADRDADLELAVRARIEGASVRLSVDGWRERRRWRSTDGSVRSDLLLADSDWRWDCDAALRFGRLPVGAGERHGFDATALLGRPVTDLFAFDPGDGDRRWTAESLAERDSFSARTARLNPSGGLVSVTAIARRDASGGFAGYMGGARRMREAADVAMGERLQRALRRPLERIVADAELVATQVEGAAAADYAVYAADIAGAGRHLVTLLGDLRDLETVERTGFATAAEPVDLAYEARRAAGLLSVRASEAGVSITRPGPDERMAVRGESRRVLQILVNLLDNVVRFSAAGGVVAVAVGPGGRVTVADTGGGIAAADQERIFDKFARVDARNAAGSGLGLYISRRLARAMGGDVTVASAPGEGARFTLRLPADPPGG